MLTELSEHPLDVLFVILFCLGVYEDVIHVRHHAHIHQFAKDGVHPSDESGWHVAETVLHNGRTESGTRSSRYLAVRWGSDSTLESSPALKSTAPSPANAAFHRGVPRGLRLLLSLSLGAGSRCTSSTFPTLPS